MKFMTLASGSTGNCALVWSGTTHILIDAGISMKKTVCALRGLGLELCDLDAVLVTHGHSDHIAGLAMITKYSHVVVRASGGTVRELQGHCADGCAAVFSPGQALDIRDLRAMSFPTPHDSAESTGFVITDGTRSLAFVTDLGCVTADVRSAVTGADAVVLESNHDPDMLRAGPYPWPLKRRVAGRFGHLSNGDAGAFAKELAESGTRTLLLAHLSRTNNTPETALSSVLSAMGSSADLVRVAVAPAFEPGPILEV